MKTKTLFRVGALCLALALISTALLSGTFAKYATAVTGSDTALVARWNFDAKNEGNAMATDLDIFTHTYNTAITGETVDGEPIIAPGIQGDFDLNIAYLADVDADLVVAIAKDDASVDVPLEFVVKPMEAVTPTVDWDRDALKIVSLAELPAAVMEQLDADAAEDSILGTAPYDSITLVKSAEDSETPTGAEVKVFWRWAIDGDDTTDTELGNASAAAASLARTSYILKVTMTATQIAPTTAP